MDRDGERPAGLPIIAREPDEPKVVGIQGTAPLARFEELVRSNIRFDLKSLTGSNTAGSRLTLGFSAR
jgi:hypothetical protein